MLSASLSFPFLTLASSLILHLSHFSHSIPIAFFSLLSLCILLHSSCKTPTMTTSKKSKAHSPVKPAVHEIPAKAPVTAPSPPLSPVEDNQDGTGVIGLDPWLEPYKGGLIHR